MSHRKASLAQSVHFFVYCVHCVDEFLDVSCDFERAFICGYTKTDTGMFSWERTDASILRYMQNSRGGTYFILLYLFIPLLLINNMFFGCAFILSICCIK